MPFIPNRLLCFMNIAFNYHVFSVSPDNKKARRSNELAKIACKLCFKMLKLMSIFNHSKVFVWNVRFIHSLTFSLSVFNSIQRFFARTFRHLHLHSAAHSHTELLNWIGSFVVIVIMNQSNLNGKWNEVVRVFWLKFSLHFPDDPIQCIVNSKSLSRQKTCQRWR